MREPKYVRLYGQVKGLSEMSTVDLLNVVEYYVDKSSFEDPKEAAVEVDRRIASKIREKVSEVNNAIGSLWEEIRQVKANPTYKTNDYCELCRKWYPKGTHIPSEKCRA